MNPQDLSSLPIINPATRTDEEILQVTPCFGMAYSLTDAQCNQECLVRPRCVARLALQTWPAHKAKHGLEPHALDAELGTNLQSVRVALRVMRGEPFDAALGRETAGAPVSDELEVVQPPAPPPPPPVAEVPLVDEVVAAHGSLPETSAAVVHPKTKASKKAPKAKAPVQPAPKPPKPVKAPPPPKEPAQPPPAAPSVLPVKEAKTRKEPGRPKEGTMTTTATATKTTKKKAIKKAPPVKRVPRDPDEHAAFDRERLKSAFVAALKDKQKLPDVMYKGAVVAGPVVDLSGKVYRAGGRTWPTLTEYVAHIAGTKDYDGRSYCAYSVPRFFRPEASTDRAAIRNKKKQETKVKAAATKPAKAAKAATKKAPAKKTKAKKKAKAAK